MFCKKCKKLIKFEEEYLHDGENVIHLHCYICSNCQKSLAGKFYYRFKDLRNNEKKNIYCDTCYHRLAPVCFHCLKIIEDISLIYGEKIFHLNCFCCYLCQKPFKGELVFPYENQIYCSKCYENIQKDFHSTSSIILTLNCLICRQKFQPGDLITKHQNESKSEDIQYIHNSCFVCEICHENLSNSVYYSLNNQDEDLKFQCKKCHDISINICFNCFKPFDDFMIIYNNRWYHDECFKCKNCNSNLKTVTRIMIEPDGLLCEHCLKSIDDQ